MENKVNEKTVSEANLENFADNATDKELEDFAKKWLNTTKSERKKLKRIKSKS